MSESDPSRLAAEPTPRITRDESENAWLVEVRTKSETGILQIFDEGEIVALVTDGKRIESTSLKQASSAVPTTGPFPFAIADTLVAQGRWEEAFRELRANATEAERQKWIYVPINLGGYVHHFNIVTVEGKLVYEGATSEKQVVRLIAAHNNSTPIDLTEGMAR
jgi:hypothetical protein